MPHVTHIKMGSFTKKICLSNFDNGTIIRFDGYSIRLTSSLTEYPA